MTGPDDPKPKDRPEAEPRNGDGAASNGGEPRTVLPWGGSPGSDDADGVSSDAASSGDPDRRAASDSAAGSESGEPPAETAVAMEAASDAPGDGEPDAPAETEVPASKPPGADDVGARPSRGGPGMEAESARAVGADRAAGDALHGNDDPFAEGDPFGEDDPFGEEDPFAAAVPAVAHEPFAAGDPLADAEDFAPNHSARNDPEPNRPALGGSAQDDASSDAGAPDVAPARSEPPAPLPSRTSDHGAPAEAPPDRTVGDGGASKEGAVGQTSAVPATIVPFGADDDSAGIPDAPRDGPAPASQDETAAAHAPAAAPPRFRRRAPEPDPPSPEAQAAFLAAALDDLSENPDSWDFFAAVRIAQAAHPHAVGSGRAGRVEDEPLRFKQAPTQRLEPGPVRRAGWSERGGRRVFEIVQVFLGPLGPRGPLPPHVTADAIREARWGRPWLSEFLDVFTHRLVALFYRAWEAAQPVAARDLGRDDPYPAWINSLFGAGPPELRDRDALPDDLRRYAAGWLAGGRRSAAGLAGLLEIVIGQPVALEEFAPEWLPMRPDEQARLGLGAATLGLDAALGSRHFTVMSRLRIRTRPLDFETFESLLPGGGRHDALRDAVRSLMGLARAWELQPVLRAAEVPPLRLDGASRLGWDSWAAMQAPRRRDPDDVVIFGTYAV